MKVQYDAGMTRAMPMEIVRASCLYISVLAIGMGLVLYFEVFTMIFKPEKN